MKVKLKIKPPKLLKLAAGPDVNRFQEYAHDLYLGGNRPARDSFTQKPSLSLDDFVSNRLEAAAELLRKE